MLFDYLIEKFGMSELYEANNKSGWFDCACIEEFEESIATEMDKD